VLGKGRKGAEGPLLSEILENYRQAEQERGWTHKIEKGANDLMHHRGKNHGREK